MQKGKIPSNNFFELPFWQKVVKPNPPSLSRSGVSKAPSHDLPSEQGDWIAYFSSDNTKMRKDVNKLISCLPLTPELKGKEPKRVLKSSF